MGPFRYWFGTGIDSSLWMLNLDAEFSMRRVSVFITEDIGQMLMAEQTSGWESEKLSKIEVTRDDVLEQGC